MGGAKTSKESPSGGRQEEVVGALTPELPAQRLPTPTYALFKKLYNPLVSAGSIDWDKGIPRQGTD